MINWNVIRCNKRIFKLYLIEYSIAINAAPNSLDLTHDSRDRKWRQLERDKDKIE